MASSTWSRIYHTKNELSQRQTIPGSYLTALEERLVIACKPLGRLQRGTVRRTMKESRSFDVSRFCQQHRKEDRIRLNVNTKNILESIATRHNIRLEPNYKILENFLFPQQKPVTRADSNEHWAYSAASLKAARNFFGDRVFNAIDSSHHPSD
ncbi:conserved hypothetical protein [Histoplasma capsulatum H143]|uniref:Uncharacterized protein n=1 Tax=Ajellomyces capsulatus (strain H143) TaxID=544712 RepID=C6HJA6_AJECH|nr:conserved hypothetical protein [Histoplasma capsulatum H143]